MNIEKIELTKLKFFEDYPFNLSADEAFDDLVKSIENVGVITPIIVRPLENGNYEIISGHRRADACRLLGYDDIPAVVREISRDEAIIIMVDENLTQRSEILPSEKAFAYRMKLDALNRQGQRSDLTFSQLGKKLNSYEEMAKHYGESKSQIHRFVRLTYLDYELLNMVDRGEIAFGPAVELSYLTHEEQRCVCEAIELEESTPSLSQSQRMKKLSEEGNLSPDDIFDIMAEVKGNQVETIKVPTNIVQKHFKQYITANEMQDFIVRAVEHYCRYLRNHELNRDDAR